MFMGLQHMTNEGCQANRRLNRILIAAYVKGSNKKGRDQTLLVDSRWENKGLQHQMMILEVQIEHLEKKGFH